jgi:hypothetical protein
MVLAARFRSLSDQIVRESKITPRLKVHDISAANLVKMKILVLRNADIRANLSLEKLEVLCFSAKSTETPYSCAATICAITAFLRKALKRTKYV